VNILTGIDILPGSPGGSIELLRDLYLGPTPLIAADVFMLDPAGGQDVRTDNHPFLLSVAGKTHSGPDFWSYVERLTAAINGTFRASDYEVIHLQHLAFGATPALQRAFPQHAKIALVHGTDLLYAAESETQAQVLHAAANSARAVVVPTTAMADQLRRLTPIPAGQIVNIPWGVPDSLLRQELPRPQRPAGPLKVLYAGRLSAEKATSQVISAVAGFEGAEVSVAAPVTEFSALAKQADLSHVRYLGWLSREKLWEEFSRHDLLMVPSLKLEAFGLVAVEAQACGLPVVYQPVPGLVEVLGESSLAVDFGDLQKLAACFKDLSNSPHLLDEMRSAGLANSSRFPLSRTARELRDLSVEVARSA
jgi:glycosyltransferase involved in cell wall biosynthesis